MPILTAADQPTYFPGVTQTGAALDGLLRFAQALCESSYGANRSLDQQSFTEIISVNPMFRVATLSHMPVLASPVPVVSVRTCRDSWGRITQSGWFTLDAEGWSIDYEIGQLNLFNVATEAKVTYTAGFDFTASTQTVQNIKSIAGVIVDWAGRRFYGQLDSYLNNPPGEIVESFNYVRPDTYIQTVLQPLRKYAPRKSYG